MNHLTKNPSPILNLLTNLKSFDLHSTTQQVISSIVEDIEVTPPDQELTADYFTSTLNKAVNALDQSFKVSLLHAEQLRQSREAEMMRLHKEQIQEVLDQSFKEAKLNKDRHEEAMAKVMEENNKNRLAMLEHNKELLAKLKQSEPIIEEWLKNQKILNEKKDKKLKLNNRVKLPARQAFKKEDFLSVIEFAKKLPFGHQVLLPGATMADSTARDVLALTFLFLTGLRISNLLSITYADLNNFFVEEKDTMVTLVKVRGTKKQMMSVGYSKAFRPYCEDAKEALKKLNLKPNLNQASSCFELSRSQLTRRINKILSGYPGANNKTLRSHSFRIGFVTSIASAYDLQTAQQLVGHASLQTTSLYDRNTVPPKKRRGILRNIFGEVTNEHGEEID